jgi:hypothetical protein
MQLAFQRVCKASSFFVRIRQIVRYVIKVLTPNSVIHGVDLLPGVVSGSLPSICNVWRELSITWCFVLWAYIASII